MKTVIQIAAAALVALWMIGCGDDNGSSSGGPEAGMGPACSSMLDCADGTICVSAGGAGYCSLDCSVSASACSASAACEGVGSLTVSVCQPAPEEEEQSPTPEEEPRIPCATDAECQVLQANAICAQFEGIKDCTIPCAVESDCDTPSIGGMGVDFMTCIPDEAQTDRTACLPRKECFTDPMSCISMPGMDGMDMGGMGGSDEGSDEEDDFGDFGDFDDEDF